MTKMMKTVLAALGITTALMGVATAGELTVVNNSDYSFVRVYAHNLATGELWTGLFADNPIGPSEVRTFHFATRGACENWNLEVDIPPNIMTKAYNASVCGGATWTVGNDIIGNGGSR